MVKKWDMRISPYQKAGGAGRAEKERGSEVVFFYFVSFSRLSDSDSGRSVVVLFSRSFGRADGCGFAETRLGCVLLHVDGRHSHE